MNRPVKLRQPEERQRGGSPNDGSIVALTAIMLVPLVIGLAIVVDSGRVWAERAALQNAVEVTAASAASTWIRTSSVCPTSVLAYLTKDDATPSSHSCTTTGNSRAGTITVTATDASSLFFSSLLGRSSASINASTTVKIGSIGSLLGVWPVALCEKHPSIVAWRDSGFSLTTNYTITLQTGPQNCGSGVGGNWGVLDFNGGANSTSETINWVKNGYEAPLDVGNLVFGSPGGLTNSIGIDSMIGKTILIPLFDQATASGSNALYRISGFVRAVLLGTRLTGAAASRSLTVRFETTIVDRPSGSVGGGSNFGITSWAICAYDNKGVC
ncbi:MAG: hypothetical protein EBZ98_04570, partial [Actinobacteria bacterium]|jgi:hypothetical protein|nr:hypothetical protein [Acidimicrobiia bacterium]NBX13144.1 hypothetical protein [Acidimicrobiia bacterium]NDE20912.1 hypothetical protein [Actinomycetota bacterium]NDF68891.1 hypothetical protein [Actinomycetota bacterium]NDG11264.1 hypothetical protein [Actinomycetota bacterium]